MCGRGPQPHLTKAVRQTQARDSQTGERHCRSRVGPVCRFRGRGGGGAPVEGILATLSRVWGGGCLGQS